MNEIKTQEKREELILKLLESSSTEEVKYMYEHGDWNDLAKKCFVKELRKREALLGGTAI